MSENIVKSNAEYLNTELNKIKSEANKSSINSRNFDLHVNSTTNIPNIEPEYIRKLLKAAKELNQKFIQDLDNLNEIGKKFDQVDESLKIEATKLGMEITGLKLGEISITTSNNVETEYSINTETEKIINDITIPKIDLDKYNEDPEDGFYLWISGKKYTLEDFKNSVLRGKYNYTPEQALEAFIACIIAESDKTIDDTLGVTTVILNRCESSNWGPHYQNGTNPFDQLFAKGGQQFSVITEDIGNGLKRYQKYMPSVVGMAAVEKALAAYGTDYQTLRNTVIDALEGGVRNHDYTGYRGHNCDKSGNVRNITNTGNEYRYENPSVDKSIADKRRAKRKKVDLSNTEYNSSRKIWVEEGADLNNVPDTMKRTNIPTSKTYTQPTSSSKNTNTGKRNTNTSTNTNTDTNASSPIANSNSPTRNQFDESNNSNNAIPNSKQTNNNGTKNNNQASYINNSSTSTNSNSTPNATPNNTPPIDRVTDEDRHPISNVETETKQNNSDLSDQLSSSIDNYEPLPDNHIIIPNESNHEVDIDTPVVPDEVETTEPLVENTGKGNPYLIAAGLTAAIGSAVGAAAYGSSKYKKEKEEEENEDDEYYG